MVSPTQLGTVSADWEVMPRQVIGALHKPLLVAAGALARATQRSLLLIR